MRVCVIRSRSALKLCHVLALVALLTGCDDDKTTTPPTGSGPGAVRVVVNNGAGVPVANATVLTDPRTSSTQTNTEGVGVIGGLDPGTYTVVATQEGMGTGMAAVVILASQTSNANLSLDPAVVIHPQVVITSPAPFSEFPAGEEVFISATVSDADNAPEDWLLVWASDQDGELSRSRGEDTEVTLAARNLSEGTHRIRLLVVDADGFEGDDVRSIKVVAP